MRPIIFRSTTLLAALAAASATLGPVADAAELATVVSSHPVIVSVPVAQQICSEGRQYVQRAPSGVGAVIGAVAGGVLGNGIGGGFGRAAATAVGVVAGSVLGNNVEADSAPVDAVGVQRCQTVTRYENRIAGYDVMYDYAGRRYSTRMQNDPGTRFPVTVQPADAIGSALPAPASRVSAPAYERSTRPRIVYQDAAPTTVYDRPVPATVYEAPAPATVYESPVPTTIYEAPVPATVYYGAPAYTVPPVVYAAPLVGLGVGLGLGYYGGYHRGYGYRGYGGYRGGHGHWGHGGYGGWRGGRH